MRTLLYLSLTCLLLSCQTEQKYSREGPEIDLVKQLRQAYLDQDWETYRSGFADTAKIYSNSWKGGEITPDQYIENHKALRANLSNVEIQGWDAGEEPYMEMVLDDDDEKWVSTWFLWRGTLAANGEMVDIPVHLTSRFEGGKIVVHEAYFNMLPFSQALAAATAEMEQMNDAEESENTEE